MPSDPEIHCSPEEGARFREGVYHPSIWPRWPTLLTKTLFPNRTRPSLLRVDEVPRVPRLRHMIGPSVIALGMGLERASFLLWPNLIAVNGFSIWWLFWSGSRTQFVVIGGDRALEPGHGESIFAGMGRMTRRPFWPWFFFVATLVSFFWPGWAAESADFTASQSTRWRSRGYRRLEPIALAMLAFIWPRLRSPGSSITRSRPSRSRSF